MTAQKLYEVLVFLDKLDKRLSLQPTLENVRAALSSLADSPANTQYQNQLAAHLATFENAASQLSEAITPTQRLLIQELGGGEFFDPLIAEQVKTPVEKHAMTPAVARDFVQNLANRRATFLTVIRAARESLEKLHITASELAPGEADLAFVIPGELFRNELDEFAKELKFINRLLQHYNEALTNGDVEPVKLEELSSSTPTIALLAAVPVIHLTSFVVHKFLDAWKKIEEIRLMRAKVAQLLGEQGTAVKELDEKVTSTVDEVLEEVTEIALKNYNRDGNRKNELKIAIRDETQHLFAQIERGLKVEFRAEPPKDGDPEKEKALEEISQRARVIQFPAVSPEPLLLKGEDAVPEDTEITVRRSKRTQKTTTTSGTKKGSQQAEEDERE